MAAILAIETSGQTCGLALVDAGGPIALRSFAHGMELSRRLVPEIDTLLRQRGATVGGLAGIAVSLGPGSFTGLRIGVTTAKALAWAAGVRIIGVPTLAALASECRAVPGTIVRVLMQLGPADAVIASYRSTLGWPEEVSSPVLFSGDDPVATDPTGQPALISLGEGELLSRLLTRLAGRSDTITPRKTDTPDAASIARLASVRALAGAHDDAETLAPLYLRASAPEARRAKLTSHA